MNEIHNETAVFGGGCFWCTEAVFAMLRGVVSVEPGYAGGTPANPTYEQVSSGKTGHAEVIEVRYNPDEIAFEELLRVFFATHDPTTQNRQGSDVGSQYRSVIFYTTPRQGEKARHYIDVLNTSGSVQKIVTEVAPLGAPPTGGFYLAEDHHKNYYKNNASAAYCQLVIAPKVERVEEKFKSLLR